MFQIEEMKTKGNSERKMSLCHRGSCRQEAGIKITGEIVFSMPTHVNVRFSKLVYTIYMSKQSFLLHSYSLSTNIISTLQL